MKRENSQWTAKKRREIYDLFELEGMTQDEIVEELGYSRQQVSRILKGYESNGMLSRPIDLVSENRSYYAKLHNWQPVKPKTNPDIAYGEALCKAGYITAGHLMAVKNRLGNETPA